MGKTKTSYASNSTEDRAYRELANLKLKDLKMACLVRGMDFDSVINFDVPRLSSWFVKHYDNGQDNNKLVEYDSYVDGILRGRGYKDGDALLSPALKYAVVADIDQMDKPRELKPNKPPKEDKPKAVKDEVTGVRSGTKKAMTFNLAYEGVELDDVIEQVKEAFPAAEEKSIKIWYKKAIKQKQ